MGLGTAVQVLRGSRAQKIKPWMLDITGPSGAKLYGAGTQWGEAWWKVGEAGRGIGGRLGGRAPAGRARVALVPPTSSTLLHAPASPTSVLCPSSSAFRQALAGMLTGRGLLAGHTKATPGQRAYAVVSVTEQGAAFMRASTPLVLQLSADMLQQEREAARAATAAAAAAAAASVADAAAEAKQQEGQRLFRLLQDVRKVSERWAGQGGVVW